MCSNFQMQQLPNYTVYDPSLRVYELDPVHGQPQMMPIYQPIQRKQIQVHLKNQDQWRYLHESKGGNEMLMTINGKPLFPKLQYQVQHLDACTEYDIGIKMVRRNQKQFVHDKTAGWIPDEKSDEIPKEESNEVFIRESGANLMKYGIDFGHVKIYNEKILKANEIPSEPKKLKKAISCKVNLRCLYVPVMTIYENDCKTVINEFQFEETQFMAVSEYKNKVVKVFKIQNNKSVPGKYRRFDKGSEQEEALEEAPVVKSAKTNRKRSANAPLPLNGSDNESKKFKGSQAASSGSLVNSMNTSGPVQNNFEPLQPLNRSYYFDSTNTSISSNMPLPSMSPPMTENQMMAPTQNYFEYGYEFLSTSSSSPEMNRFSTSPPMKFDENQDPMATHFFPDPMDNYSNPTQQPNSNCFGNEYNDFYPMQMKETEFNAKPSYYSFDFNNDYKF
ncbi:hypothetical protein B9Z55_022649 [Caenorhabditis nigoni]|uniref:T-box domain-containing protein n=1 Tax=Caenorhabditis nigoni TaxID=1611254 RepID=A0A2G5SLM3_9PELO|nr:hypothetical protein B9Z55_022649 [Caenorhabditis nigoni]